MTATECVSTFEEILKGKIEEILPMKECRYTLKDKPWITKELSNLSRRKNREYVKKGKSSKYVLLQKQFKIEEKNAIRQYREKQLNQVKSMGRKGGYSVLKKMGTRLGEQITNNLNFPSHCDKTDSEIANDIVSHFSKISQEYEPIQISDLNLEIQQKISQINKSDIPQVMEHEVYSKIKSTKKPNSSVREDIPKRLIEEFSVELAAPATMIINNALQNLEFPQLQLGKFQTLKIMTN